MSKRIRLLEFEDFLLDTSEKALRRNGERVPLSPKPMAMLLILIENRHRIVSHDELMERVWDGVVVEESNIATNIARLRRALTNGQNKNVNGDSRQFIETASGYGYQFVAEVREVEREASRMETELAAKTIPEPETSPSDNPSKNPPAQILPKPEVVTLPPVPKNRFLWIGLAAAILATTAIWSLFKQKSAFVDPAKIRHVEVISWKDRFEDRELLIRPSPNGQRLAYPKSENGQSHIFIQSFDKQAPVRVTEGDRSDFDPIWSPDSLQIAYQSRRDSTIELAVVDLPTRRRQVLRTFDLKQNYRLLRWSNQAHKFFFTDGKNVFVFFPETGATTNLTNFKDEIDGPSQFGLSLNEEKIAYTKKVNGNQSLFVAQVDGSQEKLLANAGESPADPEWFPDNEHIVYASRYSGSYQTAVIGINDDSPIILTSSPEAAYPYHISPDGKRIFYVIQRGEGDIYRCPLNGESESEIPLNTGIKGWIDISRNGTALAFQRFEPFSSSLNGKIFEALLGNDLLPVELTANGFDPRWAPNGKGLAFMRKIEEVTGGYQLYLIETENVAPRLLSKDIVLQQGFMPPTRQWQQPNNYSWSPDGSQLIFTTRKDGISNLSVIGTDGQSQPARSQNNDPKMKILSPIWSPDGARIIYLAQAATTGKARRSLIVNDGSADRTIFRTESPLRMIGWEDNEHFLVGLMESRRSMLGELALKRISLNGEETQIAIAQSLPIYLQSLQLSPDSGTLAFTARQNDCDNIWLYSLATKQLTKLTNNTEKHHHLTGLVWLPDGGALCYSKQSTSTVIKAMKLFD